MRVLIGCERSGIVREAFRRLGHDALSCDLEPAEDKSDWHLQCDILEVIQDGDWDMMICHPECRYVSVSGMHRTVRGLRDPALTTKAITFAEKLWAANIPLIVVENPVGVLSTRSKLGKPSQIIQPYQFGEDASKKTCLWTKGLSLLKPTRFIRPRIVVLNGRRYQRWANQTDGGQNRLGPSEHRSIDRARTYPGIAEAMANQFTRQLIQK